MAVPTFSSYDWDDEAEIVEQMHKPCLPVRRARDEMRRGERLAVQLLEEWSAASSWFGVATSFGYLMKTAG